MKLKTLIILILIHLIGVSIMFYGIFDDFNLIMMVLGVFLVASGSVSYNVLKGKEE